MKRQALAAESPALQVRGLSIEAGDGRDALQIVDDLNLEIARAETLCLVGESGSGKSMTARGVMGMCPRNCRIDARELRIDAVPVTCTGHGLVPNLLGDRVSMIPQNPLSALNPLLRLETQLTEAYVSLGKGSRREGRRKALALLDEVGIDNPASRLGQYPHELSGGQCQRILIAMALMCDPSLLIADEPTTALDATTQLQVLQLLRRLKAVGNLGMLFITHDLAVVAHVADRVAVLYAGQVVEEGLVREVISEPAHPYTQALIACTPDLRRDAGATMPRPIPGMIHSRRKGTAGCVFVDRCGFATLRCREGTVPVVRRSATHVSRCLLA